jgi:hypothetical protein
MHPEVVARGRAARTRRTRVRYEIRRGAPLCSRPRAEFVIRRSYP